MRSLYLFRNENLRVWTEENDKTVTNYFTSILMWNLTKRKRNGSFIVRSLRLKNPFNTKGNEPIFRQPTTIGLSGRICNTIKWTILPRISFLSLEYVNLQWVYIIYVNWIIGVRISFLKFLLKTPECYMSQPVQRIERRVSLVLDNIEKSNMYSPTEKSPGSKLGTGSSIV